MKSFPDSSPDEQLDSTQVFSMKIEADYSAQRREKRKLLAEQESRWAEGNPPSPEEILARWPTDPLSDDDAASVLIQDFLQRQSHGEAVKLQDYQDRFPEHKDVLSNLASQINLQQSLSGVKVPSQYLLRFPEVGELLFGYRLVQELGCGAFGRVFLAEQQELANRRVALKVSAIEGQEPRTLAQMQHTHIMPILALHEDVAVGLRAVSMPYFGGASLSRVMQALWKESQSEPQYGLQLVAALKAVQQPAPISDQRALAEHGPLATFSREPYLRVIVWIMARLAEGLQHAHDRGVIHRDIKPANILLGADGQPLLLDFNLSQLLTEDSAHAILGGTIAYMSPEHLRALWQRSEAFNSKVDHRSDLYALGMVLFEALTGRRAFEQGASDSSMPMQLEAMAVERSKGPLSLRSVRKDVPWSLESILRKSLAPDAADRYQQAEHLAEDLRRYLDDRPLKYAPEVSVIERFAKWSRRHPRVAYTGVTATLAACLLVLAGMGIVELRMSLRGTQEELHLAQAEDRKQAFEKGALKAVCLVNTTVGPDNNLTQGIKVCEQSLALYGLLEGPRTWQEPEEWRHFSEFERQQLADETRQLLVLLAAGRTRLAANRPEALRDALALLDRAEAIPNLPASRMICLDRARYLDSLQEPTLAKAARQTAASLALMTARGHYQAATALAREATSEAFTKAIEELDRALALDPRHYWSWMQRGICHAEQGEAVLAAADFGQCAGLWPEFAWGHFNLGWIQARGGKLDEAIACYSRALSCDPTLTAARINRGLARLELKHFADALQDFDQEILQGPSDAGLLASRAIALEGLGRHAEADAALAQALANTSTQPAMLNRIRWTYAFAIAHRKPGEARQAFEAVLKAEPRNKEALYGLAMLAMEAGHAEEALRRFDQAIAAAPQFQDARRYRAIQLARKGEFTRASQDVNWCLEAEPRNAESYYAAACVASLASKALDSIHLTEQAADLLGKAFARGIQRSRAEHDPDLAALRSRTELWNKMSPVKHVPHD